MKGNATGPRNPARAAPLAQADELAASGCRRVADARELEQALDAWLTDPAAADQAGRDAQQYVRTRQGATRRNVEMICRILGRTPAVAPGAVATDEISAGMNTDKRG